MASLAGEVAVAAPVVAAATARPVGEMASAAPIVGAATVSPPSGYRLVAETEYLALYISDETAEVAVLDKEGETMWYSNPPNRGAEEKLARGATKERLGAQFSISYYTPSDQYRTMNSYHDSVARRQFEISEIENGVRVHYHLGQEWSDSDYLPIIISEERLNELILSRLEKNKDMDFVLSMYESIILRELQSEEAQLRVSRLDTAKVFRNLTVASPEKELSTSARVKLADLLINTLIDYREDTEFREQLDHDYLSPGLQQPTYILKDDLWAWDIEDIISLVKEIGVMPEEIQSEHEAYRIDRSYPSLETFSLPIEYTLSGRQLRVTIPGEEIDFPLNVLNPAGDRVSYHLNTISLLEFFGAAGAGEQGYILVPDGCGALIYLNNQKTLAEVYSQPIYGDDNSLKVADRLERYSEQCYLPVFGMRRGSSAFLAVIEGSDAAARIRADVAGRVFSYNTVYPEFTVVPVGESPLRGGGTGAIKVYQSRGNLSDIKATYTFLSGADADYVGMARRYRDYLIERGLRPTTSTGDLPLVLGLIGGIERQEAFLGIPRQVVLPMTTYRQAKAIVEQVLEAGVRNLQLMYTGWSSWGIRHSFPTALELETRLGSRSDFDSLVSYLRDSGVGFYPDLAFQTVYRRRIGHFSASSDASRMLDGRTATLYEYNPASRRVVGSSRADILSPGRLESVLERFIASYWRLGIDGLSLRDLGYQLNSDFPDSVSELVDRQTAAGIVREQVDRLANISGISLMFNRANAYVLPYADFVINAPLGTSRWAIADREVPFYQIALHGLVGLAGYPVNLSPDPATAVLRSVEYGMSPYFLLSYESSSEVKDTDFDYLYAASRSDWLDSALAVYERMNETLRDLQNRAITDHRMLSEGLFMTVYEGGEAVIVNYDAHSRWVGGIEVPARSWRRMTLPGPVSE
jgi:hypothetical protein